MKININEGNTKYQSENGIVYEINENEKTQKKDK